MCIILSLVYCSVSQEEEEEEDQGLGQVIVLNDDGMEATEDKIKEESNLPEIEETLQGSAIFVPRSIIKPEEQQEHEEGIQEEEKDGAYPYGLLTVR